MAFTQSDVDALKTAMKSGLLRVRYADGREVLYRSLAEQRELLAMMERDIAVSAGTFKRTSVAGF